MRLIDADKLIELIQKDMEYAFDNGFLTEGFEREHLIIAIRNQPTAYDIDKVVEEFEKVKTINVDVGYGTIYKTIRKDVAIEIAKQGGVGNVVE